MVARFVRNMKGQIRVKSEIGKGTIFGVELPFEHVSAVEPPLVSQPTVPERKFRSVTSRSNTPSGAGREGLTPSPQSRAPSMPPFMQDDRPNSRQILEVVETTTHIEGIFSPLTDMQPFGGGGGGPSGDYERALSFGSSESDNDTNYPDMDGEGQTSLVHLNILAAEDNPIILRQTKKRLSQRGHDISLACDGQECHDIYVSNLEGIDVILMDLDVSATTKSQER
jgi:hypothetical protein